MRNIQKINEELARLTKDGYRYIGKDAVEHLAKTGECHHCDLSFQDLREALKSEVCLKGNVNLSWSNLTGAVLVSANLKRADLTFTKLNHANFFCANCSGANFKGANIKSASMAMVQFEEDEELAFVELSPEEANKAGHIGRVFVQTNKPRGL